MKISVPSYVIPGTYAENIEFLADKDIINGIELLFFMYDSETRDLFMHEIDIVKNYHGRFFYTLHMPDYVLPEHHSIIEMCIDFVDAFVIHPPDIPFLQDNQTFSDSEKRLIDDFSALMSRWIRCYGPKFRIENLIGRNMRPVAERVSELNICFDSGHCEMRSECPQQFYESFKKRISEIHFHGIVGKGEKKKDHRGHFESDFDFDCRYGKILSEYTQQLHLEVFSWSDVKSLYTSYVQKYINSGVSVK